jgi:dihydrofolate reductase
MSDDRVIGHQGKMPWHIPADLAHFKTLTMGHTVVMGRRTFEAIGQPLPGRTNIVVSRSGAKLNGCLVVHSLREALESATGDDELFICGGAELYQEAFPISQRLYLTIVHGRFPGDVHFPEVPQSYQVVQREERPEAVPPLSYLVYENVERVDPGASAGELQRKGQEALGRKLYFLARNCFELALTQVDSPEISSNLAFCLAKSGGDPARALQLAQLAVNSSPDNLSFLFNLGRVQILVGAKVEGLATLRQGVQLGGGDEFLAELARWGSRTPPPIPSLPRNHPLNKYLGILRHRLGLR